MRPPRRRRACLRRFGPLLCLLLTACGDAGPASRPNVVLVSVDTLRWDALGAYGSELPTPAFDALAAEGVLAEVAIAPAPETAPSQATLLTGADVARHGVRRNGVALPEDVPTLAEAFRAAGYRTAAFASSFVLDPRFGWGRGFDHYDANFPEGGATLSKARAYPGAFWEDEDFAGFDRRAEETTAAALAWLARAPEPFFLFVHYFDPHAPYAPPPAYRDRTARHGFSLAERGAPGLSPERLAKIVRRYHAEVLYVDAALQTLREGLRTRADGSRTLLAVTADHGEGLGQHGWLEHAVHVYEELVRVPLLLHWPGSLPAGRRIRIPVGLVDLAPTLADLAGVALPGEGDGRSLAAVLRGDSQPEVRPLLGQRRRYDVPRGPHRGEKFFARTPRWKYIRASQDPDELYDLDADAGELRNVLASHPEVLRELSGYVDAYLARARPRAEARLSEEERRGLEALGYAE